MNHHRIQPAEKTPPGTRVCVYIFGIVPDVILVEYFGERIMMPKCRYKNRELKKVRKKKNKAVKIKKNCSENESLKKSGKVLKNKNLF